MNGAFTKDDTKMDVVGNFHLPEDWWSRPYEYAWVLANARAFREGIPYRHPLGAVIWVNLSPSVVSRGQGARW